MLKHVETDNMAAMGDISETFVTNGETHHQIGENGTIDGMSEANKPGNTRSEAQSLAETNRKICGCFSNRNMEL